MLREIITGMTEQQKQELEEEIIDFLWERGTVFYVAVDEEGWVSNLHSDPEGAQEEVKEHFDQGKVVQIHF